MHARSTRPVYPWSVILRYKHFLHKVSLARSHSLPESPTTPDPSNFGMNKCVPTVCDGKVLGRPSSYRRLHPPVALSCGMRIARRTLRCPSFEERMYAHTQCRLSSTLVSGGARQSSGSLCRPHEMSRNRDLVCLWRAYYHEVQTWRLRNKVGCLFENSAMTNMVQRSVSTANI
jgi:hypothetical protein